MSSVRPRPLAFRVLSFAVIVTAAACEGGPASSAPRAEERASDGPGVLAHSSVRPTPPAGYEDAARVVAEACPRAGHQVCVQLAALTRAASQGRCADARLADSELRRDRVAFEAAVPWGPDRDKLHALAQATCAPASPTPAVSTSPAAPPDRGGGNRQRPLAPAEALE